MSTEQSTESDAAWEPTRWWQVLTPDGSLWCETSDEDEAREDALRPGHTLRRLYRRMEQEWRAVECGRGPCWKGAGHDGPCQPGWRDDPRRATPPAVCPACGCLLIRVDGGHTCPTPPASTQGAE